MVLIDGISGYKRNNIMQQTKTVSFIEAALNTAIGFFISMAFWPLAASFTGIEYSTQQHLVIVLLFTIISVARGYVIRRFFNSHLHQLAKKISRL